MNVVGADRRKITQENTGGGDRIEEPRWRKSTHSGPNGGNCVEVAASRGSVAVRDSKDPDGPTLTFPRATWRVFTTAIKQI
jgi:hypothetical protein